MALPIIAPVVAAHAIFMMPAAGGGAPVLYLVGVYTMSVCYGLYYAARRPRYDYLWVYGIVFCFFYLAFLLWQTYWAIATTRSASWGTRPASAGLATGTAVDSEVTYEARHRAPGPEGGARPARFVPAAAALGGAAARRPADRRQHPPQLRALLQSPPLPAPATC